MSTVGSSVNFTWTFTGDPHAIEWGIKQVGADDFQLNGRLLSVNRGGTQTVLNQRYNGRINGIWSGNSQSGQVVFTLSTIEMKDMESYLCMLRAGFGDSSQFDYLKLVVEGNYGWFSITTVVNVFQSPPICNLSDIFHTKSNCHFLKSHALAFYLYTQTKLYYIIFGQLEWVTECKYGGPLGQPMSSCVKARLVRPQEFFCTCMSLQLSQSIWFASSSYVLKSHQKGDLTTAETKVDLIFPLPRFLTKEKMDHTQGRIQ